MTWTAPMTAVANATFTAAQFNLYVRDNLLETSPAKATTAGRIFVTSGVNSIAEREITADTVSTLQTTASGTYTDLTTVGPQKTVATGVLALVLWAANTTNNVSLEASLMSVAVSGATTIAASDGYALCIRGPVSPQTNSGCQFRAFALTPGNNTFTAKYRANGGSTATFTERRLTVIAL